VIQARNNFTIYALQLLC